MPDHRTPVATRLHSSEPVPFILLDSDQWNAFSDQTFPGFSEITAEKADRYVDDASRMVRILLERESL